MIANEGKFAVNWQYSLAVLALVATLASGAALAAQDRPADAGSQTAAGAVVKNVGAVKSISGKSLVLKTDAGPEITISVLDGTRIVRLAAGQTDLKNAPSISLAEVQVGDRILLRGRAGENGAVVAPIGIKN